MSKNDLRMTVKESADFLGVNTNTIYDWIREGRLKADKEGKSYKIDHMSVHELAMAKSTVDKEKQLLISIELVRKEYEELLDNQGFRIIHKMESIVNEFLKFEEELLISHKEQYELDNTDDIFASSEDFFRKMELRNKKLMDLLLGAREEIEFFYENYDVINNLRDFYSFKESKRNSIDETLEINKAIKEGDIKFLINKCR